MNNLSKKEEDDLLELFEQYNKEEREHKERQKLEFDDEFWNEIQKMIKQSEQEQFVDVDDEQLQLFFR